MTRSSDLNLLVQNLKGTGKRVNFWLWLKQGLSSLALCLSQNITQCLTHGKTSVIFNEQMNWGSFLDLNWYCCCYSVLWWLLFVVALL